MQLCIEYVHELQIKLSTAFVNSSNISVINISCL